MEEYMNRMVGNHTDIPGGGKQGMFVLFTNLSISFRHLCLAAPFDGNKQIWLINLLIKKHHFKCHFKLFVVVAITYGFNQQSQGSHFVLACMYFLLLPRAMSFGSLPTQRLKKGKVAQSLISRPSVVLKSVLFHWPDTAQPPSCRWIGKQEIDKQRMLFGNEKLESRFKLSTKKDEQR